MRGAVRKRDDVSPDLRWQQIALRRSATSLDAADLGLGEPPTRLCRRERWRKLGWAALGLGASQIVVACAESPAKLSQMTPAQIQTVQKDNLCEAYAFYKNQKKAYPVIDNEVQRRDLSCSREIETLVSDCSAMHITNVAPDPHYANVTYVTVKNDTDKRKKFRVSMGNISSSRLEIAPDSTQSYGIVVGRGSAVLGSIAGAVQGTRNRQPSLYDCFTAT
jgi:hypothetical protein